MDIERQVSEEALKEPLKKLNKRLEILETRMDALMKKVGMEEDGLKDVHKRLLRQMDEWKSTRQLAEEMGYTQEYISRCVNFLKTQGHLQQRRKGKRIFYKRVENGA